MFTYEITVPNLGTYEVSSPTELTDEQAYAAVQPQAEQERQRLLRIPYSMEGLDTTPEPQIGRFGRKVAGLVKGAVVDPIEAGIQLFGGEEGRRGVAEKEAAYQAMRRARGEEGFEGTRLIGNVLSPATLLPAGAALKTYDLTTKGGRLLAGAASGAAGSVAMPVTEAPEDISSFLAEKIEQVGLGALVGGLVTGGIEGIKGGAKFLKDLTRPLSEAGRQSLIRRYFSELAGNDKEKFISALQQTEELVPGSRPTVAQALSEFPESVNIASAQEKIARTAEGAPVFSVRGAEQEAARLAALQQIGQTPEALQAAVTARAADASRNYGDAFATTLTGDPTLAKLASNPYFNDALPDAVKLAEARGITAKTDLTQFLQFIKISLDKQLTKSGDTALSATEKREVAKVKKELVSWVSAKNPAYKKAREAFAEASKPINAMEVGQELVKKLNSPLDRERAGSFALALREAPTTIKKASGTRFETLEEVLTPKQVSAVRAVEADLKRADKAQVLARASREAGIDVDEVQLPQLFNFAVATTNAVLRLLRRNAVPELNREMAKLFADPKALAIFMSSVPKGKSKEFVNALYSRLTPENQKLLTNILQVQVPVKALTTEEAEPFRIDVQGVGQPE
jgi:hypothetical protein